MRKKRKGRKLIAQVISRTPLKKLVQLSRYIKQFTICRRNHD
jgi:hypothetical protein